MIAFDHTPVIDGSHLWWSYRWRCSACNSTSQWFKASGGMTAQKRAERDAATHIVAHLNTPREAMS